MTVLRWILLTALAIAFILLAVGNWTPTPYLLPDGTVINPPVGFRLPDGFIVHPPLPILLGFAFVAGWLPTWLIHLGSKAMWKRKLAKLQRDDETPTRALAGAMPAQAQPTIVPPAGA